MFETLPGLTAPLPQWYWIGHAYGISIRDSYGPIGKGCRHRGGRPGCGLSW